MLRLLLMTKILKLNEENKPRIFANTSVKKVMSNLYLIKVYLHFVIIEKMINVHHGQFKHLKCYMIIKENDFL